MKIVAEAKGGGGLLLLFSELRFSFTIQNSSIQLCKLPLEGSMSQYSDRLKLFFYDAKL